MDNYELRQRLKDHIEQNTIFLQDKHFTIENGVNENSVLVKITKFVTVENEHLYNHIAKKISNVESTSNSMIIDLDSSLKIEVINDDAELVIITEFWVHLTDFFIQVNQIETMVQCLTVLDKIIKIYQS